MKRGILGFVLLGALLALGLFVAGIMEAEHKPIEAALNNAADSALGGNWQEAGQRLMEAKERWEAVWEADAALADHAPMEEIDALFARLGVFCREADAAEFGAGCRELARLVSAMKDAHRPNWWNLL